MKKIIHNNNKVLITLSSAGTLFAYISIYGRFFPNKQGLMGHDHALSFPAMLDFAIWIHKNGLWEIPWFTPSFCGGVLQFAHPQSGTYSLPSFLLIFMDPLFSTKISFFFFAIAGYLSCYFLLRVSFSLSTPSAFWGAGIFLFNGFYSHRMIMGHLGFHGFMLLPLILLFITRPLKNSNAADRLKQIIFDSFSAGVIFAYLLYSAYTSLLIPSIFAILLITIVHGMIFHDDQRIVWVRFAISGITGIILSTSKIISALYVLGNFHRSDYKLPGADSFMASVWLILKSIFTSPAFDTSRINALVNQQWHLERHEWEYSLTIVPLILMAGFFIRYLVKIDRDVINKRACHFRKNWIQFGLISFLLIMPVALNTFSPEWNQFLKKIPLIKSSSSLIRWYIIYIPITILMAALIFEKWFQERLKWLLGIVMILSVAGINSITNHDFYHSQTYDPREIITAYHNLKSGLWEPEIKFISCYTDQKGRIVSTGFPNNLMVHNSSQRFCYEPLFGYRLENFPAKSIHLGSVFDEREGFLNIKNPACYVWPLENECSPGDHFSTEQMEEAVAFVNYHPFSFKMPWIQKIANTISLVALAVVILCLGIDLMANLVRLGRKPKEDGVQFPSPMS